MKMKRVLEAEGYLVTMITEDRVGYIVYEDEFQIVAEPFKDMRIRSRAGLKP